MRTRASIAGAPTTAKRGTPEAGVSGGASGLPLRDGFTYCLKVFLAMRIGLAIVALVGVALLPDLSGIGPVGRGGLQLPGPVGVPGWDAHPTTPGWHNLFTAFERFDALWYLRIAAGGYESGDGSAAFFPLYPLLVRGLSQLLGGHPLAAGLVVSNAALVGALVLMYGLTRIELSEEAARRAVVYAAVFPTAFFFLAPYSESLFLLLVLAAFWGARSGRPWIAGVTGALAALTRSVGLILIIPLALEAVRQSRQRGRRPLAALAWAAGPAAGSLLYLGFWRAVSGDWLAPLHQQANWLRQFEHPALTVADGTREAFRWIGLYPGGYHLLDWLIAIPVLGAALYLLFKAPASYTVYAWMSILVPLSFTFAGRPLMSFPRFALPIFPIYWAFAEWTSNGKGRHELMVASSAGLLGLMTLLFVNWYYIV